MIKLIPIRFWKNISLALFLIGLSFALVGTFCIKGKSGRSLERWRSTKQLCRKMDFMGAGFIIGDIMFTYNSLAKENACPAGFGGLVSPEMAGALSAGLTGIFSLVAVTLVIYSFYSEIMVPIIGTVAYYCNAYCISLDRVFTEQKEQG